MKTNQCKIRLILILTAILTASCASTSYYTIDVMQPAMVNFPENIVNVAIVDNAGAQLNDSIANTVNIDPDIRLNSMAKNIFLESLAQFLNEEAYFYEVKKYPYAMRTDTRYEAQIPLSETDIRQIAQEMDVDAVISIDILYTSSKRAQAHYHGFIYSVLQTNMSVLFRGYNASGKPITPLMLSTDSIMGDGSLDAYKQIALEMSEGMVNQLVPHWQQQERWIYSDRTKSMKEAKEQARTNQWTEAAKTWEKAFETAKNDKQRAKIASNIALANESLDDIENAVAWIRIASNLIDEYKNSVDRSLINWYKLRLLEREQSRGKLLIQIGNKENKEE